MMTDKSVLQDCNHLQKIGVISQKGVNSDFVLGTYYVIGNLLRSCGGLGKYQVFQVQNSSPFVEPLVYKGIQQAILEERYTQRGYCQINAEPIMNGMLEYSAAHPDTEFVMVMKDSIYVKDLNYFLGVNRKALSRRGYLLNTTIISCGENSPFEMDALTFQSVLKHELGHRFGATDQRNRNPGGLYNYKELGTHCTTPGCIMNVANSLRDGQLAARRRATYCPACLRAIKRELSR